MPLDEAHGYFDMDLDILWEIVTVDLPALITGLNDLIGRENF